MDKIEHIGIAVKDLEASNALFAKLFGVPHYKVEEVASEGVKTSFFKSGPNKIELLEATKPDSPIAKFVEKKGEGIHHIAFAVEDIVSELERLKGMTAAAVQSIDAAEYPIPHRYILRRGVNFSSISVVEYLSTNF